MSRIDVPTRTIAWAWVVFGLTCVLWTLNAVSALDQILGLGWPSPEAIRRIPYLARVDISTVTTLVLVLTSFAVSRGIQRLAKTLVKTKLEDSDAFLLRRAHFPFHPGFRSLLVQLGLLGTIFAFIVAFSELSGADSTYDPKVLIAPLGTALWSTFAGIFFAFLVVPAVERVFEVVIEAALPSLPPTDPEEEVNRLRVSFAGLEQRLHGAGNGLLRVEERIASLESQLARLDGVFDGGAVERLTQASDKAERSMSRVGAGTEALRRTLAQTNRGFDDLPQTLVPVANQIGKLSKALDRQSDRVESLATSLGSLEQRIAQGSGSLSSLSTELRPSRGSIEDLRCAITELTEDIRDVKIRLPAPHEAQGSQDGRGNGSPRRSYSVPQGLARLDGNPGNPSERLPGRR